jgi:PAS domain S-box-containing protein
MKQLQDSGLNKALSEAGDGVLAVSPDRRVVFWNRAAERLLGYAPGEAIGRHACEVLEGRQLEGRDACRPECQVLAAAEEGLGSFDLPARTKWGESVTINMSTLTLPPRNGEGPLVIHLFRDAVAAKSSSTVEHDDLPGAPSSLTPRELEVLRLLAAGANTRVASERLGVSPATVRNHVQNLLGKLGVHSRLEAVAYATRRGLLTA